jgi:DNA topoisomerase-1
MMPPDEINLNKAMELLEGAAVGDEPLGHCPDTGKPIYLKTGRFGSYVQMGHKDDEEKPKNASLMKGMELSDVTLDVALKLLSLPRTLGEHADMKEPIVASNGRFGPYIKCGSETRSLPAGLSPMDVTFDEAVALLAQPKTGGRGRGVKKEPLKVFDASPVTKNPVQLLQGSYGPYVTDGETNASLPRDSKPEELTFEAALDLLAVRAAMGGSKKKKAPRKAAAKKAPATKKAATKKSATTKAATKKTATKKKATKKAAAKKDVQESTE